MEFYDIIDRKIGNKVGNKIGNNEEVSRKHGLNSTREKILSEMGHNPNVTKAELIVLIGISDTAIDKIEPHTC